MGFLRAGGITLFVIVIIVIVILIAYQVYVFVTGTEPSNISPDSDPVDPMAEGDYTGQVIFNTGGNKDLTRAMSQFAYQDGRNNPIGRLNVYWNTNSDGTIVIPDRYPDISRFRNYSINILNMGLGTVIVVQNKGLLCPYNNCAGRQVDRTGPYWTNAGVDEPVGCFSADGRNELPIGSRQRIFVQPFRIMQLNSCNYNNPNMWVNVGPSGYWQIPSDVSTTIYWTNRSATFPSVF